MHEKALNAYKKIILLRLLYIRTKNLMYAPLWQYLTMK